MHAVVLLLLACGAKDDSEDSVDHEPTADSIGSVADFRGLVEQSGWTVGRGAFTTSSMEHCCEAVVVCLETDPSVPYATYALPPAPDQVDEDHDRYWMWGDEPPAGTSRDYRLRPDEAVVWFGTVPPPADYVGFRTMLSTRDDGYAARKWVLGAAGRPLNQRVIASERGLWPELVWGDPMVVVTSADARIEQQVIDWLVASGFPRTQIQRDRLAGAALRMGLEPEADSFVSLVQVVDPEDPAALAAWREKGATVLRLTPGNWTHEPDLFGVPPLPPRGSGPTESVWSEAVGELARAVKDTWPETVVVDGTVSWFDHPTFDCWDDLQCKGDTHDRLRAQTGKFTLEATNYAVVVGVNHVRSGKATASTIAAHRAAAGSALNWVADEDLVGSARAFLGDHHPMADDLFAVVIDRSCDRWQIPCIEVPYQCPAPLRGEEMEVLFTEYLDPTTGVGPAPGELLLPRVMKFFEVLPP